MLSTSEVGARFVQGLEGEASSLFCQKRGDYMVLRSYATPIALYDGHVATFTTDRFSQSTTRHLRVALAECSSAGVEVHHVLPGEFARMLDEVGVYERGRAS